MNVSSCVKVTQLDAKSFFGDWDSIIIEGDLKSRILNHALLSFSLRPKLPRSVTGLHGMLMLIGPPGTGKTTLARGLAEKMRTVVSGLQLAEVNAHGLMSSDHGRSQQAVTELMEEYLPGLAAERPTIVLLDEVENLAIARSQASLEANPVDVHRATDAVLTALDNSGDAVPGILYVTTSNFPQAIDGALRSRADSTFVIPKPPVTAIEQILKSTLLGFGEHFPALRPIAGDRRLKEIARRLEGADGRQVRKIIVEAMAVRRQSAIDPDQLRFEDLKTAAEQMAVLIQSPEDARNAAA
jgi:SpoVK/Ycf46/Vps4 family AAA+-type ATPase